jgi:thiol:disulfide interchange protein DsbD
MMVGALLCVILLSWAGGITPGEAPTQVVHARMLLATDGAHPGLTAKAAVEAQVDSGYHINDHKPSLEYLIPTEVRLEPSKQISVEKLVYPKGELKKFAFADQPLSVYQGTLLVGALLNIAPGVSSGNYPLNGKLTYQACNDNACLPPASAPLALTVKVVDRGVPLRRANADVFNRIAIN